VERHLAVAAEVERAGRVEESRHLREGVTPARRGNGRELVADVFGQHA
jgi:hypothetical protein